MKEATGELSMTAIVVVVLGILAVALPMIIRTVTNTAKHNANCSVAYGCSACDATSRTKKCYYIPDDTTADDGSVVAGTETEISCGCDPDE